MRKIKPKKKFLKRPNSDMQDTLNLLEKHQIVEAVARKIDKARLAREIKKDISKEVLTAECTKQITDEAVAGTLMIVSNILMNNWKQLTPRDTRLKVMYDLFKAYFDKAETPDAKQLAAENEFERQTGLKVIRDQVT